MEIIFYCRIQHTLLTYFHISNTPKWCHPRLIAALYYDGGSGAKHNLISPNDATSYFTMSGKSFPKYISK